MLVCDFDMVRIECKINHTYMMLIDSISYNTIKVPLPMSMECVHEHIGMARQAMRSKALLVNVQYLSTLPLGHNRYCHLASRSYTKAYADCRK